MISAFSMLAIAFYPSIDQSNETVFILWYVMWITGYASFFLYKHFFNVSYKYSKLSSTSIILGIGRILVFGIGGGSVVLFVMGWVIGMSSPG
jgi:hypothetical protein